MANRMHKRKNQRVKLTEEQADHLLMGWCLDLASGSPFQGCEGPSPDSNYPFYDEKHRRELWLANKSFLMSLIGQKQPIPGAEYCDEIPFGTRPRAWWDYDAPATREVIGHKEFGYWPDEGIIHAYRYTKEPTPNSRPVYEAEFTFLKRHSLLLVGEEEGYIAREKELEAEKEAQRVRVRAVVDDDDEPEEE